MNDLTNCVADSSIGTIRVKLCKHQGVCVAISKVKSYTNTNKEKTWMLWEHRGVRKVNCRMSTLVLGIYAAGAQWC